MGMVGFETAIGVCLTYLKDEMPLNKIIEKFTINPAKILGVDDFGAIKIGSKANLTVIDKDVEWVVKGSDFKSKCKFTPFEGKKLKGKAIITVVNGEIYEN